jgi:phage-related minor tail protein
MNTNEFKVKGSELIKKVEELIKQGNVHRIIIKNDEGKTYIEIPLTIGVIGAVLAPILAAVGALAALAANFTIEVVNKES